VQASFPLVFDEILRQIRRAAAENSDTWRKNQVRRACEAGDSIKAWGASPRIRSHKK